MKIRRVVEEERGREGGGNRNRKGMGGRKGGGDE